MKVETTVLQTINNYANKMKVTTSYIYRLVRDKRMSAVEIDGVKFIDVNKFPKIPTGK